MYYSVNHEADSQKIKGSSQIKSGVFFRRGKELFNAKVSSGFYLMVFIMSNGSNAKGNGYRKREKFSVSQNRS